MKSSEINETISVVFVYILTLMFVHAKLIGQIDWPWWKVFLPVWPVAVFLIALMSAVAIAGFISSFWSKG